MSITPIYQIKPGSANYSPASRKVQVRRYLDGSAELAERGNLHMFYRDNETTFEEIDPQKTRKNKKFIRGRTPPSGAVTSAPATNHPWRNAWSDKQLTQPPNKMLSGSPDNILLPQTNT